MNTSACAENANMAPVHSYKDVARDYERANIMEGLMTNARLYFKCGGLAIQPCRVITGVTLNLGFLSEPRYKESSVIFDES